MPRISIPLVGVGIEVVLELQLAFATTFDRAGYGLNLRYDVPLPGGLSEADHQWVKSVIANPG